jgi:hypothetical protein
MRQRAFRACVSLFGLALAGCQNTTGETRLTFRAAAAGPDLAPADIANFLNLLDFDVSLSKAILHIGAIYLNANARISTADDQFGCYGGGRDVGQVLGGLDVDLLVPDPQPFPVIGEGIQSRARAAAVWLTGTQRVDQVDDPQVILDVAGTAQRAGQRYPFEGKLHIRANHVIPPQSPATPGVNPICKQRIVVTSLPTDIRLTEGGLLLVRVDPFDLFAVTDFSQLPGGPPLYRFSDRSDNLADQNVYGNLRTGNIYRFFWQPAEGRPTQTE